MGFGWTSVVGFRCEFERRGSASTLSSWRRLNDLNVGHIGCNCHATFVIVELSCWIDDKETSFTWHCFNPLHDLFVRFVNDIVSIHFDDSVA